MNNGDVLSIYGDIALQQANTLDILKKAEKDAQNLRKEYEEAKKKCSYLDGEESLNFNPPYIGVLKFLAGLKNEQDKLLTPEFREVEYFFERIKKWKEEGFNSDEKELF